MIRDIADKFPDLTSVVLNGIGSECSDKDIQYFLSKTKKLTTFHYHYPTLYGSEFIALFQSTPVIFTDFTLCDHNSIKSDEIIEILKLIPTLKKFSCGGCWSVREKPLAEACVELNIELMYNQFVLPTPIEQNPTMLLYNDEKYQNSLM